MQDKNPKMSNVYTAEPLQTEQIFLNTKNWVCKTLWT